MEKIDSRVEFESQIPLPSLIVATMKDQLATFQERHADRFRYAILRATVRKDGCDAILFTDTFTEEVKASGYDPRAALSDALDTLHVRIVRALEEPLTVERAAIYEDSRGELWYANEVAQLSTWERNELGIHMSA